MTTWEMAVERAPYLSRGGWVVHIMRQDDGESGGEILDTEVFPTKRSAVAFAHKMGRNATRLTGLYVVVTVEGHEEMDWPERA